MRYPPGIQRRGAIVNEPCGYERWRFGSSLTAFAAAVVKVRELADPEKLGDPDASGAAKKALMRLTEELGEAERALRQDAYADMPEDDRASTAGQRIINRIEELENVVEKDEVKDDRQNEKPEQRSHDNKQRKQITIGGIIVSFIILLLGIYFF